VERFQVLTVRKHNKDVLTTDSEDELRSCIKRNMTTNQGKPVDAHDSMRLKKINARK
jgi:hypothetical protein